MKKLSVLMGILLITSLTALNAQRGQRFNNEDEPKGRYECKIPDLTDEQESKIEKLRIEHWKEMKTFKADLSVLRAEMQKLRIADNPDKGKIDAKLEEMGAIKTKMAIAANHHHFAVRELLTDDQKTYFDLHNKGPRMGEYGRGNGPRGNRGKGYHRGGGRGYGQGDGQGYGYRDGRCRW